MHENRMNPTWVAFLLLLLFLLLFLRVFARFFDLHAAHRVPAKWEVCFGPIPWLVARADARVTRVTENRQQLELRPNEADEEQADE